MQIKAWWLLLVWKLIVSPLPTKETTKIRRKSAGNIAAAQTDGRSCVCFNTTQTNAFTRLPFVALNKLFKYKLNS